LALSWMPLSPSSGMIFAMKLGGGVQDITYTMKTLIFWEVSTYKHCWKQATYNNKSSLRIWCDLQLTIFQSLIWHLADDHTHSEPQYSIKNGFYRDKWSSKAEGRISRQAHLVGLASSLQSTNKGPCLD
jgi:hypothetical protein